MLFKQPDIDYEEMLSERMLLPAVWILTWPLARGLQTLKLRLVHKWFLGVIIAAHIIYQAPYSYRAGESFIQRHLNNVVTIARPDTVYFSSNDINLFGQQALLQEMGRTDIKLVYMNSGRPYMPAHLEIIQREFDLPEDCQDSGCFVEHIHKTRDIIFDPRYRSEKISTIAQSLGAYPLGPVFLLPAANSGKTGDWEEIREENIRIFTDVLFLPQQHHIKTMTPDERLVMAQYLTTLTQLEQLAKNHNDVDNAIFFNRAYHHLAKPWDDYYKESIWEELSRPYWRDPRRRNKLFTQ